MYAWRRGGAAWQAGLPVCEDAGMPYTARLLGRPTRWTWSAFPPQLRCSHRR